MEEERQENEVKNGRMGRDERDGKHGGQGGGGQDFVAYRNTAVCCLFSEYRLVLFRYASLSHLVLNQSAEANSTWPSLLEQAQ